MFVFARGFRYLSHSGMSKQFWLFLLVGLAVAGGLVWVLLFSTQSNHLELTGSILKVRVLALNNASLVMADFRVTNPSGLPFVVKNGELQLDPFSGDPVVAKQVSKTDIDNVFKYQKLIGPKYNEVLTLRDRVPAGTTVDRMVGGRFELVESAIARRKALRLRIEDVDGTVAVIAEK